MSCRLVREKTVEYDGISSQSDAIVEHIADLSLSSSGWTRELNLVSWNDREPRFEIRSWNADHTKMSRGITLHEKELKTLSEILKARF